MTWQCRLMIPSFFLLPKHCSFHLFDAFDDFSGVVSSIEREDDVLEEKELSEGRVEYTQSEKALSPISVDHRCTYRRYGFPLV